MKRKSLEKNGFGFKLVLNLVISGSIETFDHNHKLKYTQEFGANLESIGEPKIVKGTGKPYTKVVFKPDYKRFGIDGLSPDMLSLLERRIYDIAAVTDKKVVVKYNGNPLPAKTFLNYIDMYIGSKSDTTRVYEEANPRWEYAVALAPTEEFTQVSFVNGIYTGKGGKHVEYLLNQIIRKLTAYILKRRKVTVKPQQSKSN